MKAHPCEAKTKKGKRCPIKGDRCRNGHWVCHVHDPWGLYAKKLQYKRYVREYLREINVAEAAMLQEFRQRVAAE